jgi:hypothetical protein
VGSRELVGGLGEAGVVVDVGFAVKVGGAGLGVLW